jgi:hypothetical protein
VDAANIGQKFSHGACPEYSRGIRDDSLPSFRTDTSYPEAHVELEAVVAISRKDAEHFALISEKNIRRDRLPPHFFADLRDLRFSPGKTGGAYAPKIGKGKRVKG